MSPDRRSRVLVVDDEESIRRLVERLLGDAGYDTVLAEDGASALALVASGDTVDLLVTDLRMPEMRVTNWRASCGSGGPP